MKTLDYVIFWAVCALVTFPVFVGLMTDEILPGIFALLWGGSWWLFFTRTEFGRKAFKKGSQIASDIMGDCDV